MSEFIYNGPERRCSDRRSGTDRRLTGYIDIKRWDPSIEKQRRKKRRTGIDRRGMQPAV